MEEMAMGTSEEFSQCQILILPEVMSLILEELDFRSLMNCRLVCKRWLQEVQPHAVRRTVVRFMRKGCTARMKDFFKMTQNPLRGPFPQPFEALDVDLYTSKKILPYKVFLVELHEILHSPLLLTRFSPGNAPLKLALPIIIHSSSSLEHLTLHVESCEMGYEPPMDPEQKFPKLRHLNTDIADYLRTRGTEGGVNHFPSIVAWIVNASPKLETWESRWCTSAAELGSQLLLGFSVDVMNNMKTLALSNYKLTREASEHFLSLPLSRLEHLKLHHISSEVSREWEWDNPAVVETVKKCVDTLKKLDLHIFLPPPLRQVMEFPVCRNVEELTVDYFRNWNWKSVVPKSFPALRILNAGSVDVGALGDSWNDLPPFIGIQTLRARCFTLTLRGHNDGLTMKFLEKFPAVERMRLDVQTLLGCCRLTATGDPGYSNFFQCLKHLELELDGSRLSPQSLSPLGALRGIDTLTVTGSSRQLFQIPFRNMQSLRIIEFPWSNNGLDWDRLQEMAEGVEKVVVSNCCSLSWYEDPQSKNLLDRFFESSSNIQCGCKNNRI